MRGVESFSVFSVVFKSLTWPFWLIFGRIPLSGALESMTIERHHIGTGCQLQTQVYVNCKISQNICIVMAISRIWIAT